MAYQDQPRECTARPFPGLIVPWVTQRQRPGTKPVRGGAGRLLPRLNAALMWQERYAKAKTQLLQLLGVRMQLLIRLI